MAVGPTENLSSGVMSVSPRQIAIASQSVSLMNALMRGEESASIDPNSAINSSITRGVTDTGVGILVDFTG